MGIDILFKNKSFLLKLYVFLIAIESIVVFYCLIVVSSSTGRVVFFNYSLSRLLLLLCVFVLFLIFTLNFVLISFSVFHLDKLTIFVDNFFGTKWKLYLINVLSMLFVCVSLAWLSLPSNRFVEFSAITERLEPLVYFCGFLGAQTMLGQFFWRNQKIYFHNLRQWKPLLAFTGGLFIFVLVIAFGVSWSRIGLKPETHGWHSPGTPVLFSQLLVALLVTMFFTLFKSRIELWTLNLWRERKYAPKFDTVLFFAIWLAAFLVWQMEPMRKQSYFNPKPTPPNFEYYPYSDAAFYDETAQAILIGHGRNLEVILRPLYVFFLAVLHMVGGQNYDVILTLQVLCLAVAPALAFMLVSLLGDTSAGLLSAILVIFREKNSIALTNILEVSHSKLLLSDLPTMVLMMFFIYAILKWLKNPHTNYSLGIISGASFGLVVLVRSQSQALLPVLLVGIVLIGRGQWRKTAQRLLVFMLGLLIVILPWMWRNYQVSGTLAVENTKFYIRLFASGYSEPGNNVDILLGESLDDYNRRISSQIVQYVLDHPAEISQTYASYFIHNEISSVLYLPMSLKFYELRSYVNVLPFWDDPHLKLSGGSSALFFFTLGIITLGCGAAFNRLGFLGLFPLLIHFTYSFSVVIARISGWRFILPVDWIFQVYYCLGLLQLITMMASVIWNKDGLLDNVFEEDRREKAEQSYFLQIKVYFVLAFFLMIGLSLPLLELWMPLRYPPLSDSKLIEESVTDLYLENGELITGLTLENFLETDAAAVLVYGRALYPSYYKQGVFWGEDSPNLLAASQFDRLQFNLIGPRSAFVFIPVYNPPKNFPNASDVFVIGCGKEAGYLRALIVKINDLTLISSPWLGLSCSIAE